MEQRIQHDELEQFMQRPEAGNDSELPIFDEAPNLYIFQLIKRRRLYNTLTQVQAHAKEQAWPTDKLQSYLLRLDRLAEAELGHEISNTPELLSTDEGLEILEKYYTGEYKNEFRVTLRLSFLQYLSGIDTDRGWRLREKAISECRTIDYSALAESLAGLNSEKAWHWRKKIFNQTDNTQAYYSLLDSLMGLSDERAWEWREKLRPYTGDMDVLKSTAGVDDDRAWKERDDALRYAPNIVSDAVGLSLVGLDSPRAWDVRHDMLKWHNDSDDILVSLTGLDSEQSYDMRVQLNETLTGARLVSSLAGVDTDWAWAIRDKFVELFEERKIGSLNLAESLVGLGSPQAWEIRDQLRKHDRDADVRTSIFGVGYMSPWVTSQNRYPWIKAV